MDLNSDRRDQLKSGPTAIRPRRTRRRTSGRHPKRAYLRSLKRTHRQLINILDQRTGREKQILRKYLNALGKEIQNAGGQKKL